ncbi:MAG: GntR family transcriptional regulator [Sciscionella sp.]|nr:GntR family transcriptional regulator [Sciscionella sp.]
MVENVEIHPVNQESTAGLIAEQLRTAITNGSFVPGQQLGEAELAAQFQVSRGPLREAMQRLVQEGLLHSIRHRGLFVIELEPEDIFDIYSARAAVERAAVMRIMRDDYSAAADQLEAVHLMMRKAAKAKDDKGISDADLDFHQTLVEASGSRRLVRMAKTLLVETRMCLAALQRTYGITDERIVEHGKIVEAIRTGEERKVLRLLDAHMDDAIQRLAPRIRLRRITAQTKATKTE